ncbi:SH3 domain-containing protein [Stenotrophomonas sp. MMGLT7]|uniref:SH3 domain-containing protein n=1 Tax=Stenotrophomonas sp. MMGLT7 TaxID=2901227 RepID=UPI001E4A6C7A|nr:SH3 domain-containing protein [Stenotrophomonas sp. MMGLT7]MCD7097977.1 SH3 domain-containing protein [Stenotrophomonas sp. MMGLT7]
MAYARVVSAHRAPQRPPIRIAPGDAVTLGERDTDWPQFVWTTRADGLGGWVPAALFDAARGPATALQVYDTRELDADAGELLALQHELADWWWARNARGDSGWIPARVLAPATDAGAAP